MIKKSKNYRILALTLVLTMCTGLVLAVAITEDLHVNIQTTYSNGSIENGTFAFVFNISTTSDCADANIVYSNSSTRTTDSRGILSYYLPNVTLDYDQQYWLCHYRDSVLKASSKIVRSPYAFSARNISAQGIDNDSNLDLTNYNITADTGFFNLAWSYLTGLPDLIRGIWGVNNANSLLISNGTYIGYNQTVFNASVNASIDVRAVTSEVDPYWALNYSTFLTHIDWSDAMNGTLATWAQAVNGTLADNTTIAAYIDAMDTLENTTMKSYVDALDTSYNDTLKSYVDALNVSQGTWATDSFVDVTGDTMTGDFDFNGGIGTGVAIRGGSIYAQTAYFYNISSLGINNMEINGSLYPDVTDSFDLGNSTLKWKDLHLSGDANVDGTVYSGGDAVLTAETLWNANYSTFLTHIDWSKAVNGTLFTQALWNTNYTANNDVWTTTWAEIDNDTFVEVAGDTMTGNLNMNSQGIWYAANGSLGVGTTTPSQELEVVGSINLNSSTGAYLYDGSTALKLAKGTDAHYANTFVGHLAGNSDAQKQTAIGYYAGYPNAVTYQTVTGYYAGFSNTGNRQTATGVYAGYQNAGNYQTALGYNAGHSNTGSLQTAIGHYAGYHNTGERVSSFGHEATRSNSGNDVVALGYQAGKDNTVANQFIVQQANVNSVPLIQGDFSSGQVNVFGTMNASAFTGDGSGLTGIDGALNSTSWNRSGTDVYLANSGDKVGIGTITPQNLLNVLGDANITGTLYVDEKSVEVGYDYATNSTFALTSEPLWSANYSAYLVTDAYALNDSLWSLNYSDYLITKTYASNDTETLWNANYSAYLVTDAYALNDSLWSLNYSDYLITKTYASNDTETLWNANYSTFLVTDAYALNDSLWSLNYSTYLTKPTWAQAVNGTLADNTTIAAYIDAMDTLENTTMKAYVDAMDTSENTTMKAYVDALNVSQGSWVGDNYVPYTGADKNIVLGDNNLSVGGTDFFVNNNDGRVGIGTSSPAQTLTVGDATSDYIQSYGGFMGHPTANIGGTGDAAYFPEGIYSAKQNWLYGGIQMNNGALAGVGTIDTGSGAKELGDAAVADGDTNSIPTGDQVYDFVIGLGYTNDQTLSQVLTTGNDAGNLEMLNVNGIRLGSASSPDSWQIYGSANMFTAGYWRGDAGLYVGDDEYWYRGAEDRIDTTDNVYLSAITYLGTTSYYVDTSGNSVFLDSTVSDDLFVNDFARIDALRVGTTSTDPGDGNLYVEGDLTVVGHRGGGAWEYLGNFDLTGQATGSYDTMSSSYIAYKFVGMHIATPTNRDEINVRFSDDSGSTWETSSYSFSVQIGGEYFIVGDTSEIMMSEDAPVYNLGNLANEDYFFELIFYEPTNTAYRKFVTFTSTFIPESGGIESVIGSGVWANTNSVEGIQFHLDSGSSFSHGIVYVYGLNAVA